METNQAKSKLVAGLLGIFLGQFGVHNFYLGYTNKAIIQVCVSVGGYILGTLLAALCVGFLLYLAPMGMGIWGLVEGIMILTGKIAVDGKGNPLAD